RVEGGAAAAPEAALLDVRGEALRVELAVGEDGAEGGVAAVLLVDVELVEVTDGREQDALVAAPVAGLRGSIVELGDFHRSLSGSFRRRAGSGSARRPGRPSGGCRRGRPRPAGASRRRTAGARPRGGSPGG